MKKGFTLIELLIVIAILGVLAVGLLATIDPFEQLKKGRDTSTRNMLEEFYNGALRYYAINNSFPWGTVSIGEEALTSAAMSGSYLQSIVEAGELKQAFLDSSGLEEILVTSVAGEDLTICFQPQSKAFRNDANSRYDGTGGTLATNVCPDPTSSACHWCLK
jgi:prepilin-type N-terminal cleavage/methylation domain-containing protein